MASISTETRRPTARSFHAAVAVGQNMLVWGGWEKDASVAECFDLTSLTWMEPQQLRGDPLPAGLHAMAVASDGEKAYLFGGDSDVGRRNNLYSVDLATLEVRELVPRPGSTSPPCGRMLSRMVCHGRKLVVYGGLTNEGVMSNKLDVFDLLTGESVLVYATALFN